MRLTEIRCVKNKRPSSPSGVLTTRLKATVLMTDVGVAVFFWVLYVGFVFIFWECCSSSLVLGANTENTSTVDVYLYAPNHAVQLSFNTWFPSTLEMRRTLRTSYEAWKDPMMSWCALNWFCFHCIAVFFFTELFPALTLLRISWSVYAMSRLSDTHCFGKHQNCLFPTEKQREKNPQSLSLLTWLSSGLTFSTLVWLFTAHTVEHILLYTTSKHTNTTC